MKTFYTKQKQFLAIVFLFLLTNLSFAQCFTKVSAGLNHTVAIASNGTLWAWGTNISGELGIGLTPSFSLVPVQVGIANNWVDISAGNGFTLAIRAVGILGNQNTLWAWGANNFGQLGDGTTDNKFVPTQIGTNTKWTQVSAGTNHSMAINDTSTLFTPGNKTLWGWGRNNVGQLGDGITPNQNAPVQIGTAIDWGQVAVGNSYTIAQKTDGRLFSWGLNNLGQLGINSTTTTSARTQIGTDSDWSINFSADAAHVVAIKNNGTLWAWGYNLSAQLGNGNTANSLTPIQIGSAIDWTKVSVGAGHSMALKNNGDLYTWGKNEEGQLGIGSLDFSLTRNLIGGNYATISAGANFSVGIKNDGTLNIAGTNLFGQLGTGTTVDVNNISPIVCPATLSIESQNEIVAKFVVYPNPTSNGNFSIQSEKIIQTVIAFDMLGKQIDFEKNNDSYKINASNGIYTIKIIDADGNSQIKKLIVN